MMMMGSFVKFCSWFNIYKKETIRDTMLLPIREQVGLGSPPEPFYNNVSECINKVKVDYKKNELPVFISKMLELIGEQQQEVEKAIRVENIVCTVVALKFPKISDSYTMSHKMRKHHLKRLTMHLSLAYPKNQ